MRRVVASDRPALGALYDRYGRQAYSLARRICGDEGTAEDVVQEAFLAFWRNPQRFDRGRGTFSTWLLTIVHHKAVDAVRHENVLRFHGNAASMQDADWGLVPGPGADQAALCALDASHVRTALHHLPEEQRRVLALAYFGGYTQREVAGIVGVPLGTVKSRMFAGVQRLRGVLGPLLHDPAPETDSGDR